MKLLSRILLNPDSQVYLRQLQKEFNVSSNTVRVELNKLIEMKLIYIVSTKKSKVVKYRANLLHPLYDNLRGIIYQYLGIDHLIEDIFIKLGDLEEVYLTGNLAEGKDGLFIDLVVVGDVDRFFYNKLVDKAEILLKKKIRTAFYLSNTFSQDLLKDVSSVCVFKSESK